MMGDVMATEFSRETLVALARLRDPTDATLTTAEMWRELGWAGDEQAGVSFGDRT